VWKPGIEPGSPDHRSGVQPLDHLCRYLSAQPPAIPPATCQFSGMPPHASFVSVWVGLQIPCTWYRVAVLVGRMVYSRFEIRLDIMPPISGPIQAGSFGGFECSSELREDVPILNQVLTPSCIFLLDSSKPANPE